MRSPRAASEPFASQRTWLIIIGLGVLCLVGGAVGLLRESPSSRDALRAAMYFVLPALVLMAIVASRRRHGTPVLVAVGLIDLEAALLGAGPLIALAFVVAVPLVGVAVAARFMGPRRQYVPYAAAWLASSAGVAVAVFGTRDYGPWAEVVVIPAFLLVDALALAMLWQLDHGRLESARLASEAEARVLDLLNGVDLVAVHVGATSGIDFINDFALRLTGWTRSEVLGADWWDTFVPPDRREEARKRYRGAAAGDEVISRVRESTIQTKAGDVKLIRWSHVQRYDTDGTLTGVASLGEDITAARAAEIAARRGSEMLSTLVISSPIPTAVVGLDLRVQLWNPAAAELFGWTQEEVLGRLVPSGLISGERWLIGRRLVRAVRGEAFDGEVVGLCRRDGEGVRVRLYGGALRDNEGLAVAVAMQAVDVTASLAMEEQLREAHKMEAIGRLAGGVAHDFNNSLTAIGGFAALIESETNEPDTREAAFTILGAARRAADLTRELLAYSRRSILQPQTVDVIELVDELRPMMLRLLGENVAVAVESTVASALVRVDPSGLERAMLNLAVNAHDAMPTGGRLTITIERRAPDETPAEGAGWIVVTVADSGAGIPSELHSKVFDPFFTTKPVGSGTGLGLSMVKGFVVQSGGEVRLLSEPGCGTSIEITRRRAGRCCGEFPGPESERIPGSTRR